MPIYFNSTLSREPFQFDSLGIRWEQEPNRRPRGFPLYHYLQTERSIFWKRAREFCWLRACLMNTMEKAADGSPFLQPSADCCRIAFQRFFGMRRFCWQREKRDMRSGISYRKL